MLEFLFDTMMLGIIETRTTVWEVVFTILLTFLLSLLISITYIKTYKGLYYSQSFAHTLVIVSVVISVIIIVIGSNIARAFSLAGALSIIRFRSAIRDPKDVAFIFLAMAVGLATGSNLHIPAIIFTLFSCSIIYLLWNLNFGSISNNKKILKVLLPENLNYDGLLDDIFEKYTDNYMLLSVRTINLGTMFELIFAIVISKDASEKEFLDAIRFRNGNLNVTLLLQEQGLG